MTDIDQKTRDLYEQVKARHSACFERIESLLAQPRSRTARGKVVIVPGALYKERPDMGGDGRLVRVVAHELGYTTDLIPLQSCGALSTNAAIIRDWLAANRHEPLILVSLSKAGAELKLALAETDSANLRAWINVCGPLNGTHIANWVLAHPLRRAFFGAQFFLQRRDFRFITEFQRPLSGPVNLPAPTRLITVMGFPLREHFTTPFSRFCHRILTPLGPNDGTTTLGDLLSPNWPGEIYPAWGMDHYFRPEAKARALIRAVLEYLEEDWSG